MWRFPGPGSSVWRNGPPLIDRLGLLPGKGVAGGGGGGGSTFAGVDGGVDSARVDVARRWAAARLAGDPNTRPSRSGAPVSRAQPFVLFTRITATNLFSGAANSSGGSTDSSFPRRVLLGRPVRSGHPAGWSGVLPGQACRNEDRRANRALGAGCLDRNWTRTAMGWRTSLRRSWALRRRRRIATATAPRTVGDGAWDRIRSTGLAPSGW